MLPRVLSTVIERLILIVEEDPGVLSNLVSGFTARGFRVETAANGREALEILERVRPALVLLDLDMPVLDGWILARELNKRGMQLPLLLLSDDRDASHIAREIGAAGYLTKPHPGPGRNGSTAAAA